MLSNTLNGFRLSPESGVWVRKLVRRNDGEQ